MKLVKAERESAALHAEASRWPLRATSVIGEIETRRVAHRVGVDPAQALAFVSLVELDERIRETAATLDHPLRTLDAIHLATALALEDDLGALACYDERLAEAARLEGIAVVSPR